MIEPALLNPIYKVANPLRFVIGAQEYGDGSCGVRSLNRLCHWLNCLGHDASLAPNVRHRRPLKVHPEWEVKAWDGVMTDDTIAIYPDAFVGNPYHARRVVRWCLYYPGLRDGQAAFGVGERVYYYADLFRDSVDAASSAGGAMVPKRLFVSAFDPHNLYPWDGRKEYDAFWAGRGVHIAAQHMGMLGNPHDWIEFQVHYPTRHEYGHSLRVTRNFVSFDPCSAMIPEAALCGARTFHVSTDGVMRELGHDAPEMLHAFDDLYAFHKAGDVERFAEDMYAWT